MLKHKGFRLSLIGGVISGLSFLLLVAMPDTVPAVGLLIGGALVWAGLLWTLFGYYASPSGPASPSS